jgi:antitoxin component YwqK of YwqJK toxin-antitoxin module
MSQLKIEGAYKEWFENGQIERTCNYKNNLKD